VESPLVAVVAPAITQLPLLHPVVTVDVVPVVVHDVKPFSKPGLMIAFTVVGLIVCGAIGADGATVGVMLGTLVGDGPVGADVGPRGAFVGLTGAFVGSGTGAFVGDGTGADVGVDTIEPQVGAGNGIHLPCKLLYSS